tara:strand:- start:331 stop:999 length:669 start_codon:yes stop_codon:yes gene_type:complete
MSLGRKEKSVSLGRPDLPWMSSHVNPNGDSIDEDLGPCWKCKWIQGTMQIENDCPVPGNNTEWTVTVKASYNEKCECKGLLPGIDAGQDHYMCGCEGRSFYFSEPTGDGAPMRFCMTLPPERAGSCYEEQNDPQIGGWLQNCADGFSKKLKDATFTIKHKCSGAYPSPSGFVFADVRRAARKAAEAVYNHFTTGAGSGEVGDLTSQKNCDCSKVVASGGSGF